jgi:uncharacterized protein YndB with AHSA1/START domain
MAGRKVVPQPNPRSEVLLRACTTRCAASWKAWTEREHLTQWWGQPKGATGLTRSISVEARCTIA